MRLGAKDELVPTCVSERPDLCLPDPGAFSMKSVAMLMSRPKLSSSTWACRATASRIQTGGRRKPTRRAVPLLYIQILIHTYTVVSRFLRFSGSGSLRSGPRLRSPHFGPHLV